MPNPSTDRMRQLEEMLAKAPSDTFLIYALALEHKKIDDAPGALQRLDQVIALDSGYCYAYHQKGLIYESIDDVDAARGAYRAGVQAATRKGDQHALSEISAALNLIE